MNTNSQEPKYNMKLFSIIMKLNILSFNILLNFAMGLGLNKEYNNKNLLVTDIIKYLKNQTNDYIDKF